MDLSLSEEQQLLKDSVARFILDNCSVEQRRRLRDTDDQATSVSFQRVEDRAKGLFARIARPDGAGDRRITPALTHQQIADMIGTSRETVTRAVKDLKASGWLEQRGKRYLVP